MAELRITNTYLVAWLELHGFKGMPHKRNGFLEFIYPRTDAAQQMLDSFDEDQMVNMREYVAELRQVQLKIRETKQERTRDGNGTRSQ